MDVQIIISYDIETVERKVLSDRYFHAEESAEQINDLFHRFTKGNLVLKDYLDLIFPAYQVLMRKRSSEYRDLLRQSEMLRQKSQVLIDQAELLSSDPFATSEQRLLLIGQIDVVRNQIHEVDGAVAEMEKDISSALVTSRNKIAQIRQLVEEGILRFNEKMKELRKRNRRNKTALYIISFLLSVVLSLVLELTGLDKFSNVLLTLLQILVVFILTETLINGYLKKLAKETHRPDLLGTLQFLKTEMAEYNKAVDLVCNKFDVERAYLLYELDKMQKVLDLGKPVSPGTI